VAAPLLAGFAFALLALVLPKLAHQKVSAIPPTSASEPPFSAVPELAALLFLVAGLLLVFAVQASVYIRYFETRPTELQEWYPEYFPPDSGWPPSEETRSLAEWDTARWPAMRSGAKWYGGWPRGFLYRTNRDAERWADRAANLYHAGIVSLLAGVTALLVPPSDQASFMRVALAVVAGVGTLAEIVWVFWRPSGGPGEDEETAVEPSDARGDASGSGKP
jgi:hypothetical protein